MPAQKPAKHKHLLDRHGRYWARLSVPEALRSVINKRELLEALGSDRTVALRKLPGAVGRMQDALIAARGDLKAVDKPTPTVPGRVLNLRNLAGNHFDSEIAADDMERSFDPAELPLEDMKLFRPAYEVTLRNVASGRFSNEEANAAIGWAIDGFQKRGNTSVVMGTPAWRELARSLAGIHLETFDAKRSRDRGNFAHERRHPLLKPVAVPIDDPLRARILGPQSERTISELSEQFIAEKATGVQTRHDNRVTMRMLDDHLGDPMPIYRLTRQHVHSFKRALAEAPASYSKRFPGMTLPEATKANKARAIPYPVLMPQTINDKYLSRLHSLLSWAVRSELIPDNPASGVKVDFIKDASPPRLHFSPDDLARLFGEHFSQDKNWGERQWAMVVALFSGMRATELAQVKLDSVRTERGHLIIAVEEATKNAGSRRLIPVHSQLVKFGFEKLVADLRRRKETHLFPVWYREGMAAKAKIPRDKATIEHYFPRFLPRRFNVTYLPKVGIADSRKTWHSFRHTFKTGLSMAGVPRDMRDELCGHADNSAGAAYVHEGSIEAMKLAIEKLTFDGLALSR